MKRGENEVKEREFVKAKSPLICDQSFTSPRGRRALKNRFTLGADLIYKNRSGVKGLAPCAHRGIWLSSARLEWNRSAKLKSNVVRYLSYIYILFSSFRRVSCRSLSEMCLTIATSSTSSLLSPSSLSQRNLGWKQQISGLLGLKNFWIT